MSATDRDVAEYRDGRPDGSLANATLSQLAKLINAEHKLCEHAARSTLEHAVNAGLALIEAKSRVKHSEWTTWLEENCRVGMRQAQKYMKVARELPTILEAKANRGSLLEAPEGEGSEPLQLTDMSLSKGLRLLTHSPEDDLAYCCPTCGERFDVEVWHCLGCNAHFPADVQACGDCDLARGVNPNTCPEATKQAYILMKLDGKSRREAAEEAGVSESTLCGHEQKHATELEAHLEAVRAERNTVKPGERRTAFLIALDSSTQRILGDHPITRNEEEVWRLNRLGGDLDFVNRVARVLADGRAETVEQAKKIAREKPGAKNGEAQAAEPVKDEVGVTVPECLLDVFGFIKELRAAAARQRQTTTVLNRLKEHHRFRKATRSIFGNLAGDIADDSSRLYTHISQWCMPFAVCPECGGFGKPTQGYKPPTNPPGVKRNPKAETCIRCDGAGWFNKRDYIGYCKTMNLPLPKKAATDQAEDE
jgi:hypothetical protein